MTFYERRFGLRRLPPGRRRPAVVPLMFFVALIWAGGEAGTSPQHYTLNNGLKAIVQRDDSSAITVLEILIRGGKAAELPGLEGLSYLTTRLALEIPDQGKAQELMDRAARYMMTSKGDYSLIHIESLSEHLDATLGVFMAILKDPLFSSMRIERVKEFMNNQRNIENDDNLNTGHLSHLESCLGRFGYAGSVYGSSTSLSKIKGRDIQAFYDLYFVPGNMVLIAISDLADEKLREILVRNFGSLPNRTRNAEAPAIPVPSLQSQGDLPREKSFERETVQSLVSCAFPMTGISPRNFALASLLEACAGKGPGSKLWPLRTQKRLAYNVNAKATLLRRGGLFEAYLETEAKKEEAAREALKAALGELRENGIAAEEFEGLKTFVRAEFLRSNETKERRAETLSLFEGSGLGYEFFDKFFAELNTLTLDEANAFIRSVLDPETMALAIVGPKKTAGTRTTCPADDLRPGR